jgi:hypothetical protein
MNEKAISFWETLHSQYPHDMIAAQVVSLKAGHGDWFRNYGIAAIAIASHCRIGRIGFDDQKHANAQAFVRETLHSVGLSESMMQN